MAEFFGMSSTTYWVSHKEPDGSGLVHFGSHRLRSSLHGKCDVERSPEYGLRTGFGRWRGFPQESGRGLEYHCADGLAGLYSTDGPTDRRIAALWRDRVAWHARCCSNRYGYV